MTAPDVRVFADAAAVARAAALEFAALAAAANGAGRDLFVALSGGSTPRTMLATLAELERIAWSRVQVFWSDERCVPPDDANSNYRMVAEALLGHVPIPPDHVHRMPGELPPTDGARQYCGELASAFSSGTIAFDLLFLGLGMDGHTASLFPHTAALGETVAPCVANRVDGGVPSPWRLTLTYPVINAAREVAFLVDGERKADILARVLRGERDVKRYPAQGVAPATPPIWLVDRAAAREL